MIDEILIRFCFGGLMVSGFALLSDLLRPKSFGGLFGAAPSVALASLVLTAMTKGQTEAATNAHAMIAGAIALLIYALAVGYFLVRFRFGVFVTALGSLLLWFAAAVVGWVILC